jgi:hypothetical protein
MRALIALTFSVLLATGVSARGDPTGSVRGLIERVLGSSALGLFQLETIPADPSGERDADRARTRSHARFALLGNAPLSSMHSAAGNDVFEIGPGTGGAVRLAGNNGVAIATALNNYLKYTLNASISWGRDGSGILVNLAAPIVQPAPQRTVFASKLRYSWNVCVGVAAAPLVPSHPPDCCRAVARLATASHGTT